MQWGKRTTLKSVGIPAHMHKRDLCKKGTYAGVGTRPQPDSCDHYLQNPFQPFCDLTGWWKAFRVPLTLQTKIIHNSLQVSTSHSGQTNSISGIIKLHLASELTKHDLLLVCRPVLQSLYSSKQADCVLIQRHIWVVRPHKHWRLMRGLIWLFATVRKSTGRCPLDCAERSLFRARRRADDSCALP